MMMKANKRMTNISLKKETADRFRVYSKKIADSHSQALDLIIDCHEGKRKVLPEKVSPHLQNIEKLIENNFHFMLHILRKIESTQTKPTLAMMQLLFQETSNQKNVLYEKKSTSTQAPNSPSHYLIEKEQVKLKNNYLLYQKLTEELLEKITVSRSSFGKEQLRITLTPKELVEIKQNLQNLT